MKKRIVGIITAITMLMSIMPQIIVNAAEDITISNLSELEAFRDDVNNGNTYEGKTVKLTADIDMSEKYGEGKENWTPIGNSYDNVFSGTFDGCNYTINNLYINIPEWTGMDDYGLFGYIDGTLKNLNVNGSVIADSYSVAGIVVLVEKNGAVINCSFDGTVKGIIFVGGIAVSANGYISDCHCSGTVDGLHMVGGIVCNVDNVLERKGIVENCTNESTVTGGSMVGGIAGALNIYAKVTKCVNKGEVKGVEMTEYEDAEMVGGIAGVNGNSSIENCYNTGLVLGKKQIGGITGSAMGPDSDYYTNKLAVKNCYNIGNVTSIGEETAEDIGSIIGENTSDNGDIANNYYLDTCISDAQSTATALTLEQFADKSNFANWDFDTVWEMNTVLGRPVLRSGNANKHIHKICGDENCTDEHEDIEWTAWESADALPTEAGNYYLTSDVEISSTWTPADDTKLCLNGHTIKQTEKEMSVLTLSDSVFTLCDCVGTGKITGGRCGVFSGYQSTFNMYGGIITGNKWDGSVVDGGGVVVYPYNTFNMFGGEISGNCDSMTGGVHVSSNGSMNIGGKVIIKDNTNTGGNIANVLPYGSDSQINIVKPLKEGAYIGIAYHSAFTKIPRDITTGNDTDYSGYFYSDNNRYAIENGENNIVRLVYKSSDYPYYEIRDIKAFDTDRHELNIIPPNTDFKAYFVLQQISNLGENDFGYAIAAVYDTEGVLIGVRTEKITRYHSAPTGFYFDVSSEDKTVGSIKAFVWDGFNSMKPLAESEKISFVE